MLRRNSYFSYYLLYKKHVKQYIFQKKNKINSFNKTKFIITHKGMLFINISLNQSNHKFRIGEFVFTRKFFKRPLKLKKRKR